MKERRVTQIHNSGLQHQLITKSSRKIQNDKQELTAC